jgi:hypothetical protein
VHRTIHITPAAQLDRVTLQMTHLVVESLEEMVDGTCTSPKRLGNLGDLKDADHHYLRAAFVCLIHVPDCFRQV